VLAVLLEVQLAINARKHYSWPVYHAIARSDLGPDLLEHRNT
jgi:hypothetical protein